MHLSLNEHEFIRFISDLHLTPDEARLETFYDFLNTLPESCRGLFILGDFFDHWLGYDIHQASYEKLAHKLSKVNCPIIFLPGNRDFLIEDTWLEKANIQRIPDPFSITINSKKIVLTHGDQLCSKDYFYQFFRQITRQRLIRKLFLCLPKNFRKAIFRGIRRTKHESSNVKKFAIDHQMAMQLTHTFDANILIHGHIHRPGIHVNETFNRIVLDEWMAENCQKQTISYLDINQELTLSLNSGMPSPERSSPIGSSREEVTSILSSSSSSSPIVESDKLY